MKVLALFAVTILLFGFYSQETNDTTFTWSKNRKLVWDDFKGAPDKNLEGCATSTYEIKYSYKLSVDTVMFIIKNVFFPNSSWVKQNNCATSAILQHEQGHFDLAEIYARKLRKALSEKKICYSLLQQDVSNLVSQWRDSLNTQEDMYDLTTNHSDNTKQQSLWNSSITNDLKKTEDFQDTLIKLPISNNCK